jgi:hypothetical protein
MIFELKCDDFIGLSLFLVTWGVRITKMGVRLTIP